MHLGIKYQLPFLFEQQEMCVDLSSSNHFNFIKCTRKCCVDTNTFYCAIFRLSTPFGESNLQIKNQMSQK